MAVFEQIANICSYEHIPWYRLVALPDFLKSKLTHTQPYLDSDMQSRWWDFGGDTVIRADKYVQIYVYYPQFADDIYLGTFA